MLSEEVIIKIVSKLTLECNIDQLAVRNILNEIFNKYTVTSREVALSVTDIPERAMLYLAVKRLDGLSPKTLYNYKLILERFYLYFVKPINTITTNDIRMYLLVLQRDGNLKQTSMGTIICSLRSFFNWLFREEIIVSNPMARVVTPKTEKRLRHALTQEELEILRQACVTNREKAILEFLVSTGCRLSEVVQVNLEDIDWGEKSLKVIGKGNKERKVYFSVKSKALLQVYINGRKDDNIALFVTSKGITNRLSSRSIEREIKIIAKRTGNLKSIYPHLFRHTFATHKLNLGMSLPVLQRLLGHEEPSTTQIYAELNESNVVYEYGRTD